MADQLDLIDFITRTQPPPAPRDSAAETIRALQAPPPPVRRFADASPASLAAMAAVQLLREAPGEFAGIGTSWPLVAVGRAGWDAAMAHREHLVRQQLAGTITEGDREALAALQHLTLHARPWLDTPGEAVLSACSYDHLQQALAGLRCAAEAGRG